MLPNDKIKNLIEGVGVLGETLKIFYTSMINAGFDEGHAFALTIAFMQTIISSGTKGEPNE